MRSTSMRIYIAATAAAMVVYFFLPADGWARPICQVAIGTAGAGAIVYGVRRYRPAGAGAWLLFAAGVWANAAGVVVAQLVVRFGGYEDLPMPSLADVFWLALYPGLIGGLALMIRRRTSGRDWAAVVDATTISTGLGLLSWVFVIRPAGADPELSVAGHAVVMAYPVGDVVVLAMMVRLLLGSGSRNPAFRFMAGSLLAFLLGDVIWAVVNQFGWEPGLRTERLIDIVFLIAYTLFGAGALHPSVREVGQQATVRQPQLSPMHLAALTGTSLIAPAILAVQVASRQVTDGVAIVVGSIALFLLVVTRMAQLLKQVEGQARQLRDLARVDELTGLANRRAWSTELPAAIERARREHVPLSVAMIDLDFFKRFNDEYGHQAGDRLLKGAAAAWTGQVRAVDQLARYGGEEFILLLPSADSAEASAVLDRLREVTPAGQTFSSGLATWDGVETSDELIARADRALYSAKDAGRNRTMVAPCDTRRDTGERVA